jgi:hypothetical protein
MDWSKLFLMFRALFAASINPIAWVDYRRWSRGMQK